MSRQKPLTLGRLNDLTLGSFAFVPSSKTLDHLVRYLGTWSGSDKFLMVIQYAIKIIVPILHARARVQYRAGLRKEANSGAAEGYKRLGAIIADARILWRFAGLLPIIQWLTSLERNPPPTRKLLTIERLQAWSMLVYYPLEHFYYLASHKVIHPSIPTLSSLLSSSGKPIPVNEDSVGIWSCRFWALYVLLQFAHLKEDRKLLKRRERTLKKAKSTLPAVGEKEELQRRWDAFWNEVLVNVGYLPLTIHWSLEKGLFNHDIWVGVFGLLAAVASFRSGWKATALPSTPASEPTQAAPSLDDSGGSFNPTENAMLAGDDMAG